MTTTFNDLFEKLRLQAESDTVNAGTDKRRPSWGPALVLGDDFMMALADLNYDIDERARNRAPYDWGKIARTAPASTFEGSSVTAPSRMLGNREGETTMMHPVNEAIGKIDLSRLDELKLLQMLAAKYDMAVVPATTARPANNPKSLRAVQG